MNTLEKRETGTPAAGNDLNDLDHIDPDRVDTLQSSWRSETLSANSKESYKSDVRELNRWLEENGRTVSGETIRDYLDALAETLAPSTVNRKRYAILQVLKSYGDGYAPLVDAIETEIKEKTGNFETETAVDGDAIPDPDQVQLLIDTAEHLGRNRVGLIVEFLWKTAVRVTEMIEIRPDRDVEENGRVKIMIRGKGKKERPIKIEREFYHRIRKTFDHSDADHLFHTSTGNPYDRSNLYRQLKRLASKVDLEPITNPHAFRHARATWMLDNGFSLKAVSNFLGHSSTSITADLYIHDSVDYDRLAQLDREAGTNE
jgi:site-specific recombinase XerD